MIDWIRIDELQPGDHIRIPGGSSWATWRDRVEAESALVPVRRVERLQPNALSPDTRSGWRTRLRVPAAGRTSAAQPIIARSGRVCFAFAR